MSDYIFQDLLSNVQIIADFLNKPLSDDLAKLIAEHCIFKGMMKNVQSYLLGDKKDGPNLLQKGVVGNWKKYFTIELNATIQSSALEAYNSYSVMQAIFKNHGDFT